MLGRHALNSLMYSARHEVIESLQTTDGDTLMSRNYREEQELVHIRAMILELERMADEFHAQRNVVFKPDYWRGRLATILLDSDLPYSFEKRAADLLDRLDQIASLASELHHSDDSPR